jgi:hypothetical protein
MKIRSLPVCLVGCLVGCLALLVLHCGAPEEVATIDIGVFPAQLDETPGAPPAPGWLRVEFLGSQRSSAGSFLVADKALLTGWNINAFRVAQDPDDSRVVNARLNAAATKRLARFCAEPANLKQPLGLRIDGRWADFSPLLRDPGDRLSLAGFTAEEVARLERWLKVR